MDARDTEPRDLVKERDRKEQERANQASREGKRKSKERWSGREQVRPAQGWGHAHRTAGEHASEGGGVRRPASDGCLGSALSEGTAGGADSGCEPAAEVLKARGRGRGGAKLRSYGRLVSPLFPRGQIIFPEGPGLWSLTLSHCEDSQTDWTPLWLATPRPASHLRTRRGGEVRLTFPPSAAPLGTRVPRPAPRKGEGRAEPSLLQSQPGKDSAGGSDLS